MYRNHLLHKKALVMKDYQSYKLYQVGRKLDIKNENDTTWINDYHEIKRKEMLRQKRLSYYK